MHVFEPSFSSSWKMFTSEKGWFKLLAIMSLVSWIPILGQIVVLGYSFEWARRTAWGTPTAPKKRGIDYGKMLVTGGICFLVMLCVALVFLAIDMLLGVSLFSLSWLPLGTATSVFGLDGSDGAAMLVSLLSAVLSLLADAFLLCMMMRATIYDSFTAGFKLGHLAEMVRRDTRGFFTAVLALLLATVVSFAVWLVILGLITTTVAVSFVGILMYAGNGVFDTSMMDVDTLLSFVATNISTGDIAMLLLVVVVLSYLGNLVVNAMQIVSVSAVGQWFSKFKIESWGASNDPLPSDVPLQMPQGGEK